MNAGRIGFFVGLLGFAATFAISAPAGLSQPGWHSAGLVVWMAAWWMTEAVPLTATALLPFVVLPFVSAGTADQVAGDYYSPTLFLILGGAFLALAIERTGMHRRLAVFILDAIGNRGGANAILLAFMISAAILSNIISNTATSLIMMPMALAVLAGGSPQDAEAKLGLSGALPMGIAFAASIGGLGTIIGSPTNAIAVALLRETIGLEISFALWAAFGIPCRRSNQLSYRPRRYRLAFTHLFALSKAGSPERIVHRILHFTLEYLAVGNFKSFPALTILIST